MHVCTQWHARTYKNRSLKSSTPLPRKLIQEDQLLLTIRRPVHIINPRHLPLILGYHTLHLLRARVGVGAETPDRAPNHRGELHPKRDEEAEAAVEGHEGEAGLAAEGGQRLVNGVGEEVAEYLISCLGGGLGVFLLRWWGDWVEGIEVVELDGVVRVFCLGCICLYAPDRPACNPTTQTHPRTCVWLKW